MTARETTRMLQERIDAAARAGGGEVVLETGLHVCGSLELKSGVRLHLEKGAVLRAAEAPELYPGFCEQDEAITANQGGRALLTARGAVGVSVTGEGILEGGDPADPVPDWRTAQQVFRPGILFMENCANIGIEGLTIRDSRWWTLHFLRCEDLNIRGVTLRNRWPNSDGIDPDGCRRVVIEECDLVCGDDCVVLKSTRGDDCREVTVRNCRLQTSCACLKIGTETLGRFSDISFENCLAKGGVVFAVYMKDGGSVENVRVSGLEAESDAPYPLLLDAMPRDYRTGKSAGRIRNVAMSNCRIRGAGRMWIEGAEDAPVEAVTLEGIEWELTADLPETPEPKPLGSMRVVVDPARPPHHLDRRQIVSVRAPGLETRGVRFHGADASARGAGE